MTITFSYPGIRAKSPPRRKDGYACVPICKEVQRDGRETGESDKRPFFCREEQQGRMPVGMLQEMCGISLRRLSSMSEGK